MSPDKYIRKKPRPDNIQVGPQDGKLPPQALDLEQSVLGAIMLESEAMSLVMEILSPECFYKDAHSLIFKAMTTLFGKSEPIDILTVSQQLREEGNLDLAGGAFYVTSLTTRLASAANVEYHARIIQEKHLQRSLIKISNVVIKESYDETSDVFESIEKAENDIFNLTKNIQTRNEASVGDLYLQKIKAIENKKDGEIEGYITGYRAVDSLLMGIKKQELLILAARPGMGKTSFAMGIATNLAITQKIPVAVFSLEMGKKSLVDRLISAISQIPLKYIVNNMVTGVLFERLLTDMPKVLNAPLYIDDQGALTVIQLRSKIRRLISKYGIEFIVVDYLQKMVEPSVSNREQQINHIVSGLKNICKEFDIPMIALSQLSREADKRPDHCPQLSDLRESGAIEQEADIVMFVYRPSYYGENIDSQGQPIEPGGTEIIVAKNRNGVIASNKMIFMGEYTKFVDTYETERTTPVHKPLPSGPTTYGTVDADDIFNSKPKDDPF